MVTSLLVQVVSIALLATDAALGKLFSVSSTSGFSFSGSGATSASAVALSAVSGVLGLAGFIISVIAFVRWRQGVAEIRKTAVAQGPFQPAVLSGAAAQAERGYVRSVWMMVVGLITVIGGAVAIVVALLGSLHITSNPNGTVNAPTPSQVNNALASVVVYAVVLAAVLLLVELLLAYFVTESLQGFANSGVPKVAPIDLSPTRSLVLLSVVVSVAGILNFVYLGLGAVALAGPILMLVACQQYLRAFDERLALARS